MKLKFTPVLLLIMFVVALAVPMFLSTGRLVVAEEVANVTLELQPTCGVRPTTNVAVASTQVGPPIEQPAPLTRFRRPLTAQSASGHTPQEYQAIANQTNYGQRFVYDINGQLNNNQPIIVLHETVTTSQNAINFFRTRHTSEDNQASYHTLITLNGDIVYIVPPDLRAFGAGNSVFVGSRGEEAVRTHPKYPASVNNFAYHVSLETPPDGMNNRPSHSGYTMAQYQSLAWLVSRTGVPNDRITTHQAVDRSGHRSDPRSFNSQLFYQLLNNYPRTQEIIIGCRVPGYQG
ncbi:peptidoglycan recognition family protein [Limnospira sp. PMC 1249.20]|uniref:peptidoglycan recognition protein family protein n=1 Tax=Limnospira sp. PMC 1249.20 TaxID=2981047 RepID=UPI0028E10C93|nr:peptidoglycan recognition family protein [Limnospira sp. PMC 1249.20]MDT9245706.1 peptidoglycan recognition family protein [Limnospira sp. PMC 1249.20]